MEKKKKTVFLLTNYPGVLKLHSLQHKNTVYLNVHYITMCNVLLSKWVGIVTLPILLILKKYKLKHRRWGATCVNISELISWTYETESWRQSDTIWRCLSLKQCEPLTFLLRYFIWEALYILSLVFKPFYCHLFGCHWKSLTCVVF